MYLDTTHLSCIYISSKPFFSIFMFFIDINPSLTQTPVISTIAPHTILHESFSKTMFTLASPILLTNIRFETNLGTCKTPGTVFLLPYFNNNHTLSHPTILVNESYPKRTSPTPNFSYFHNHSLCIII